MMCSGLIARDETVECFLIKCVSVTYMYISLVRQTTINNILK